MGKERKFISNVKKIMTTKNYFIVKSTKPETIPPYHKIIAYNSYRNSKKAPKVIELFFIFGKNQPNEPEYHPKPSGNKS